MIRIGRYDVFDKWEIVCRAWAGETLDVGINRRGNKPSLPDWEYDASRGGLQYLDKYIRLKHEAALSADAPTPSDEFSRLCREIDRFELWSRAQNLIAALKPLGFNKEDSTVDLPEAVTEALIKAFKFGALQALRWTDDKGEIPDLEVLRSKDKPYPHASIKGKRDVLAMFCAEYYGSLDVIHIHDAGPNHVTLLDYNPEFMEGMKLIYPPEWTYICTDYKEFLGDAAERGLSYDLITADAWRGMCSEVAFDMLPTIMALCRDTVIMHYCQEQFDELRTTPDDFEGLSRAIKQRTGVDVAVTGWTRRSLENGHLVMRKV